MATDSTSTFRLPSRYIYGTTRLGDVKIPVAERVKIARAAMETGVWFHTSDQYGDAIQVLATAFSEARSRVPKLIFKVGGENITEMRSIIHRQIKPLGLDHMDIAQLCLGGDMAEQFRSGGACYDEFRRLRDEGLVRQFVLEVFPWTSQVPLEALRAGYTAGLIDACIFYLNPLQRFAANPLWDFIVDRNIPVIGMRTVCGAPVHALRDVPGAAWCDYLQKRAVEVAPIYERSGVGNWTEFCVRFAFGFPQVRATVGSTARLENLREFTDSIKTITPLPADIQADLVRLQRRWSDETDIHAKPWTM
jgi:predicted aldo/keto reductase-like oxidoreductase